MASTDLPVEAASFATAAAFSGLACASAANGLPLAAARIPVDPDMQLKIATDALGGGPDLTAYPRYYIPYATASREAAGRGKPLSVLAQASPESAAAVAKLAASSGKSVAEMVYLPLRTRSVQMSIVLDKANGDVVGVLPLEPR